MENPDPTLYRLQMTLNDFAHVKRNHVFPNEERRETDTEHTLSVAFLSWYVYDRVKPPLSLEKVLKYALVHDLLEVYAGDVHAFASPEARALKEQRELEALEQLSGEFASFPDMVEALQGYMAGEDEEVAFVKTVDKIQALVMDELAGWRAHESSEIDSEQFSEYFAHRLDNASPYVAEIFEAVIEYSKTTYWDQPE